MTTVQIDRGRLEQIERYLIEQCGGRCNKEYNPCWAFELADVANAALTAQPAQEDYTGPYAGVCRRITEMPVEPAQAQPVSLNLAYEDSTPHLNVMHSAFENWFQAQPFATQTGVKQMCRDSYAAGMGDPLVTYVTQPAQPASEPEGIRTGWPAG